MYLSLASSGGTVPIQALPGVFRAVAHLEPFVKCLGTRAIMYFDARGDAGLTHSFILIACELAFWMILGFGMTTWYDKRKLYRIHLTSSRCSPERSIRPWRSTPP